MAIKSQYSGSPFWNTGFSQLSDITDPVWLEVVQKAKPVTIKAGTIILHKGAPCSGLLLIHKGIICVRQLSEEGREIVLYRVGPGEVSILALTSLVDGCRYPAEAIAETQIKGVRISPELFKKAMAGSEDFRKLIMSIMAKRLREVIILVEEVAFERLDARLADMLCKLFKDNNVSSLNITHKVLAIELGTTREMISKLLKTFEIKKGCIKLHRGRIELLSLACLAQCALKEVR